MAATALDMGGYDVTTAADGAQAIDTVRSSHPDAVVMDIFMPVMDGLTATRQLRSDPATADIPVIAYTGRHLPSSDEAQLFAAVCLKPCAPDHLIRVVAEVLHQRPK